MSQQTQDENKKIDIKELVTSKLSDASTPEKVKTVIVDTLYNVELDKRVNACLTVLNKINDLEIEYKKANKPDTETFSETGEKVSSSYSKEKVQILKDLRERREKLDSALRNALEKNDFTKVLELGK